MSPKATVERIPCFLCRKAQFHPCGLILHIRLLNHFLYKLHIIKPKTTFGPISRQLFTKQPKRIRLNYYCTYGCIKPYLHKLGIMSPKATFERNPGYLCRKAQLHPCRLLLHIWLLNHFLCKLRVIKPTTTFQPNSRYLCTKSPNT